MEHVEECVESAKHKEKNNSGKHPCPCCGCLTYPVVPAKEAGFICPVCFWENDLYIKNEEEPSDANKGLTLKEAKRNYLDWGASDLKLKKYVRKPLPDEIP
ncbi:MAG: hypothetical protein K6F84_03650 [Lachnospiraceae bacterium]|nr:hypothetical protein [Lachnospiraceae bacterium]